jgi:hypothetical protein
MAEAHVPFELSRRVVRQRDALALFAQRRVHQVGAMRRPDLTMDTAGVNVAPDVSPLSVTGE